jgi:ribA/ribD-fused uncharacterized protein
MIIGEFQGRYRFLSNFYPAEVELDNIIYPTVEHAYQAAKTLSQISRAQIRLAGTPGQAKRMGRVVKLRPNWEGIKLAIMDRLVCQKFSKEPLRSMLIATGDARLIEGNRWGDTFWGVCRGIGQNNLGLIIMNIREGLIREGQTPQ